VTNGSGGRSRADTFAHARRSRSPPGAGAERLLECPDLLDRTVLEPTHPELGTCWRFRGTTTPYGRNAKAQDSYPHRLGWRLLRGPIPEGKELHHRCGVFACWNPDHLEPATHAENQSHMRKTHCKPGALALTGSETCSSRTSKERSITLGEYPRASAMTAADASLVSSYSLPSRAASQLTTS
jgi:hypothetical protein